MKLYFKSIAYIFAVLIISGCETNSADNTVVVFDEKSGGVTFVNKKYNQKLAEKEEKKWEERVTVYKTGKANKNKVDVPQQATTGAVIYGPPSPIRYNTEAPTDYEAYKQWRAARGIEDSPEYARFKLWQEFEAFQRWKEAQDSTRSAERE